MPEPFEVDPGLIPFRTKNPLTSFAYQPGNVRFMDQDPEEKIILFLRWHPITNLGWILASILIFLAPGFFVSIPIVSALPLNYRLIIVLLWYLIGLAYVYENFLHWFFSAFLVTNKRVIDIDFENLIYRQVSFASLEKIQDITVKSGGGAMVLFNYGDVFIQTAGEIPNIEFERIPRPDKVAHVLKQLVLHRTQPKPEGGKL